MAHKPNLHGHDEPKAESKVEPKAAPVNTAEFKRDEPAPEKTTKILVCNDARDNHVEVTVAETDIDGPTVRVGGVMLNHVDTLPDGRWRYAKTS